MSGDGFLSRWARRKQEAARELERPREEIVQADPAPGPEVIVEAIEPHDPDAITAEELAALPPVEEITDPVDLAQYLRKGVPAVLRSAAMRRMWLLDPAIRHYVDPALDYAYDWNIPGGVPGNGPLAAGFDAKGAADKFFSTLRGKISNETGEFEEAKPEVPASDDILPQGDLLEGDEVVSVQAGGSNRAEPASIVQAEKSSRGSASESSDEASTLVVDEEAAPSGSNQKTHAPQGPARRHGRALPV